MANRTKKERICVECGCTFVAYPPAKRCDACAQAQYRAALSSRRRESGKSIITCKIVCAECGIIYESDRPTKYCAACAIMRTKSYRRENSRKYYDENNKKGFNRICLKCHRPFVAKNMYRKSCYACHMERGGPKPPRAKKGKKFQPDQCIYARQKANGEIAYKTCINLNGKQIHLGYFQTRDEAVQARINAYNDHLKEDEHD